LETWEPSQHSLVDTGKPRKTCVEVENLCRGVKMCISGYHADFHEGHGTIGAWQGRGMACV